MKYDSTAKRSIKMGHWVGVCMALLTCIGCLALNPSLIGLLVGAGLGLLTYLLALSVGWMVGALLNGSHD